MTRSNVFAGVVLLSALATGCFQNSSNPSETAATKEAKNCPLPDGKYDVQSATVQNSEGVYRLLVLGAPACVKQPVEIEKLRLGRVETDKKVPVAQLEMTAGTDPALMISEDFKINLVNSVIEGDKVVREETSTWMPFLAGAAGAAVAGIAINSMFNRPQHYMPPPARPGTSEVRGYGARGDTYNSASSNYQKNWNAAPPAEQNRSFFKQKNSASAMGGNAQDRSVQKSNSTTQQAPAKKSFFRKRR